MTAKNGHHAIIEQFLADGIDHMFGNPGTVEQGFLDALSSYPAMKYILTLQESVAVLMADGYARARRAPALVQLHSTPGVGNGIGALYQARRGNAPLVVIGGDAGVRYQAMDAQMAGDLVAMAEPVTKWSTMVLDPTSLLRVLRRAIKVASTPPMGPVYVCLPQDVLDAPATETVRPTSVPSSRMTPRREDLREAAALLVAAERPTIYVGDGVAYSGAQEELTRVAELLGADVWDVHTGEVNMSWSHPLYRGMTGHMFGSQSLPLFRHGDVNLVCGTYITPEVFPELGDVFAPSARVIHLDLDESHIARNHPVDLGLLGDPRASLAVLAEELKSEHTSATRAASAARAPPAPAAAAARRAPAPAPARSVRGATPLHMTRFMEELAAALPADALCFDEALTNSAPISLYRPPQRTGEYLLTRGGSLGVGFPGAIGLQLAHPGRTVVGFSGDGGSMYTIQALWTAARHRLPVKFVVCNNGSYRLLQMNIDAYWQERGIPRHDFPLSFDLSEPPIRFGGLAEAMGVPGIRVETPAEVGPAIRRMLDHQGPFLIDLVLEGDTRPEAVRSACRH